MDRMAGGTCAVLPDMGWEYPMENYNITESGMETFTSAGFTIEHAGTSFTARMKGPLYFYTSGSNVYCASSKAEGQAVCKSLGGIYSFDLEKISFYLLN